MLSTNVNGYEIYLTILKRTPLKENISIRITIEKGKIIFEPRSAVDRAIAKGLADIKKGRVYGPFATADQMISSLKRARKRRERSSRLR